MDLILWRHAEALDLPEGHEIHDAYRLDLARSLTGRGQKHAARIATWLDRQLGDTARIWVSPALRCEQTALNLGRKFKTCEALAPGASAKDLLEAAQWPNAKFPVVLVGHQPTLGQTAAQLLGLARSEVSIRKGALWWLRHRVRDGVAQTVLMTVQTPELL
jgi:phosphohistidine phosphatase